MTASFMNSPVGILKITQSDKGIRSVSVVDQKEAVEEGEYLDKAMIQLEEYFQGIRKEFDVKLDMEGTAFQKLVWEALIRIPYGQTLTYKEIAEQIGRPKAYRAVGMACNKNPIPIIVPCHRVIGSNHHLVGYAYGLEMKQFLIDWEKKCV